MIICLSETKNKASKVHSMDKARARANLYGSQRCILSLASDLILYAKYALPVTVPVCMYCNCCIATGEGDRQKHP